VKVDLPIVGDCGHVLEALVRTWRAEAMHAEKQPLDHWWAQIDEWRTKKSLAYRASETTSNRNMRFSGSMR